jgi:hypothetical protein
MQVMPGLLVAELDHACEPEDRLGLGCPNPGLGELEVLERLLQRVAAFLRRGPEGLHEIPVLRIATPTAQGVGHV